MTDAQEETAPPAEQAMTWGELNKHGNAIFEKVLKASSKATLALLISHRTALEAWSSHGNRAAIAEAEAKLLQDLKEWGRSGRFYNTEKRFQRMRARWEEIDAAIREGRPLPRPKRKRRRKVRR